jgi:hypothetical protein
MPARRAGDITSQERTCGLPRPKPDSGPLIAETTSNQEPAPARAIWKVALVPLTFALRKLNPPHANSSD